MEVHWGGSVSQVFLSWVETGSLWPGHIHIMRQKASAESCFAVGDFVLEKLQIRVCF